MAQDTTDPLRDAKIKMDSCLTDVMPDSWEGHGRLRLRESDVIDHNIEEKAITKMNKLVERNDKTPEKAANALIRAVAKKKQE